jgi:ABC-type nitrate/sulfonate/bicarbonate transport system substrate-binding protein
MRLGSTRQLVVLSLALFALVIPGGAASAQSPTPTPVRFIFDWVPNSMDVPVLAAQEFGWFAEEGVEVDTVPGGPDTNAITLVGTGQKDISIAPAVGVLPAHEAAVPIRVVGLINASPYGFVCRPDRGIATPKDFEGKKIGAQPFDQHYPLWKAWEKLHGIDESLVQEVTVSFDPVVMFTGQVDCFPLFMTIIPAQADQEFGTPAVRFLLADDLSTIGQTLITNEAFIQEHPDAVRGFVAAYARGLQWAMQNREEAVDLIVANYPDLPRDLVEIELNAYMDFTEKLSQGEAGLLSMADELWQPTFDILQEYEIIEGNFPLSEIYTNEFLPDPPVTP